MGNKKRGIIIVILIIGISFFLIFMGDKPKIIGQNTIGVESNEVEKEISNILEAESKEPLLDVELKIPNEYSYVLPGDNVLAELYLDNIGGLEEFEVSLEYSVKDKQGSEIISKIETLTIKNSTDNIVELKIPQKIQYGKYILYVRATYNGKIASSSEWFNIGEKTYLNMDTATMVIVMFIIIFMVFTIRRLMLKRYDSKKHAKIKRHILKKSLK